MLIISACKTSPEIEIINIKYILPVFPQREEIVINENLTIKDYVVIIIYYEYLLQEWELWGLTVEKLLTENTE